MNLSVSLLKNSRWFVFGRRLATMLQKVTRLECNSRFDRKRYADILYNHLQVGAEYRKQELNSQSQVAQVQIFKFVKVDHGMIPDGI